VCDVDWQSISQRASAATPVPGGVGPVTVAMLFANLLFFSVRKVFSNSSAQGGQVRM